MFRYLRVLFMNECNRVKLHLYFDVHTRKKKTEIIMPRITSLSEKFNPWLVSHLCTAGQILHEMRVNG